MVPVVGLCGYAGSGKDTAAKVLIDRGYTRRAFADKLKEMALLIRPWVFCNGGWMCLETLVFNRDWDGAKRVPDVRRFLQLLGQGCRDVDPEFWIRPVRDSIGETPTVITDVRYPNEVEMIRKLGGVIVWIDRPGNEPANDHESESDLSGLADIVILNSGTVDMLHKAILKAVEC